MALPIRTTVDDVIALSRYLLTKPTGTTVGEGKKVLDSKYLDGRKISALKQWEVLSEEDGRIRLTEHARGLIKQGDSGNVQLFTGILQRVPAYWAILERAIHANEDSVSASDVAAHWHQYFKDDAGGSDKTLNDQAVCFFQVAEGAGLGKIMIGRKGASTRLELNVELASKLVTGGGAIAEPAKDNGKSETFTLPKSEPTPTPPAASVPTERKNNHVFITHGKNKLVLEHLKEIVTFGKFTPVVAQEHETPSKPVPEKVLEDMRSCFAGIIHVANEDELTDNDGKKHYRINENVLIEIGAAMALYKNNFILLVEKGVHLPSNLQGLYECRYEGEKLDGEATMKLLKAFNEFK